MFGAEFEGYEHWREYEDCITQYGVDSEILHLLESGSHRLRWTKDGILEMGNGENVPFSPVWIDEPRVREAYWRAYRHQHGSSDPEGYECADLLYPALRSGAYFKRLGLEVVELDERIARGVVEGVLRDGFVDGYDTRGYWKRSGEECGKRKSGRAGKEKGEEVKRVCAGGERKRRSVRLPPVQPSLEEIQDVLDRARINLDEVCAEGKAGDEGLAGTNNARLAGQMRTPRLHGESYVYDQDMATRSSRSRGRTWRDV
ncbi:hypothetical protein FB567DRAFT_634582 [Paraphoma chrysanthemicola]|uniref:Uncharacterized protein n=1 Tax=Paraphoma chrysanthemicola TaxID=798071 RepID=A0A8K0VR69_9PLEO|nr:hypothetical protein FB567DRAFT_634582 [Paraphoma chrysanthemicola]